MFLHRLINSALMAKIHTVEWTPAILNERFVQDAVNIEWFGILSAEAIEWLIKNGVSKLFHSNIRFH